MTILNAQAADLPTRKAPLATYVAPEMVAPVAFTWTGPYAGLQAGYAWDSETVYLPWVWHNSWAVGRRGGSGGAVAGYDYQIGPAVLGVQADYNASNISGNATPHGLYYTSNVVNSFGAVDVKVGFAFNRLQVYTIGGLGLIEVSHNLNRPLSPYAYGSFSAFETGYNIGAGVEYAFTNNWIGFADFRNFRTPSKSFSAIPVLGPHSTVETIDTMRLGVTYRIGG